MIVAFHCLGLRPSLIELCPESPVLLLAGESEGLYCAFSSNPPSNISWWKDGVYIPQVQLPAVFGVSDSQLDIIHATVEDSGSYQCVSKTDFSSREPELTIRSLLINVTVEGIDVHYVSYVICNMYNSILYQGSYVVLGLVAPESLVCLCCMLCMLL